MLRYTRKEYNQAPNLGLHPFLEHLRMRDRVHLATLFRSLTPPVVLDKGSQRRGQAPMQYRSEGKEQRCLACANADTTV